jgi:predicted transcriptional regulator of viral defense system
MGEIIIHFNHYGFVVLSAKNFIVINICDYIASIVRLAIMATFHKMFNYVIHLFCYNKCYIVLLSIDVIDVERTVINCTFQSQYSGHEIIYSWCMQEN